MQELIKFVCLSDTHGQLDKIIDKIPEGDVLIHTGDFTHYGYPEEVVKFNNELGKLPHKYKLVVAGNHDVCLDPDGKSFFYKIRSFRKTFWSHGGNNDPRSILTNCHYLEDSSMQIHGYKIYGCPWLNSNRFGSGFFGSLGLPRISYLGFSRSPDFVEKKWKEIPEDTEILLTHAPSSHQTGLKEITQKLEQLKFHISGHFHTGTSAKDNGHFTEINAAICYPFNVPSQDPVVFSLPLKTREEVLQ